VGVYGIIILIKASVFNTLFCYMIRGQMIIMFFKNKEKKNLPENIREIENGLKVVIYARYSTQSEFLEKQVQKIKDYCKKKGLEIVSVQREVGDGRRIFRIALWKAMRNKKADAVVIYNMSRISWELKTAQKLVSKIYRHNKILISAEDDSMINLELLDSLAENMCEADIL